MNEQEATNQDTPKQEEQKEQQQGVQDHIELQQELEAEKTKSKENYELYLRTMADMENLKKRHSKEKENLHKFALESFLKDLLPTLDSLDNAMTESKKESDKIDVQQFLDGLHMVSKKLQEHLNQNGLQAVDASGEKFNPEFHQAIQKVEKDDIDLELVDQVFVKGYTLNGRLIRPAMVSVAVPKSTDEKE